MKKTAVANLKAQLSRYLRLVKAGEEVLVTERDVPIAKLVPVRGSGSDLDALRELEAQGLVQLGSGKLPKEFWKMPRAADPEALARKAVREERERGW